MEDVLRILAEDIVTYAVNTGALYEEHKALARYGIACPDGHMSDRAWDSHVRYRVIPSYYREFGPGEASTRDLNDGAWRLRRYYEAHVRELDAHAASKAASLAPEPATGLVLAATQARLCVEIPPRSMLALLEHEDASHGSDGAVDHALPLMAKATLADRLDALPGVSEAAYDGHLGPYVTLILDADEDTPQARADIAATVGRHLDAALDYVRLPHVVLDMAKRGTVLSGMGSEDAPLAEDGSDAPSGP